MSIVISESTRTALECVPHCDYSDKKTVSKRGYKIWKIFLLSYCSIDAH